MPVEIGLRIQADNMTGRDFDNLVGDMKRSGQTARDLEQNTEKLRKEFDTLGNKIKENSRLTLDANSRWKDAEGSILSTQQASKRLESALAGVSDEQLKQIRVFRDSEGKLQDLRGGYLSNAEAARRYAQGIDKTSREFAAADKAARKFSNTLTRQRTELRNVALGAAAVTAGMFFVGKSFIEAGIRMEGYRNGLIALEGSAEAADARLTSLRDIIQLPGVSYEGATEAAVRLRTVGIEAEFADRTITEFGNSLALVGSTDLSGALLGFQQIISRGRVSQEEINQIVERSGLFAKALQGAFGSIQSEQIQAKLDAAGQSVHDFAELFISELEELDRVDPGSAANSIQNLQNSVFELRAGLGDVLLPTVVSVVQGVTSGVNAFNEMDDATKSAIVSVGGLITGLAGLTTVVATVGAGIGALNAYLLTATGASGFAGLAALIAPAAPLLVGLGALAAVLGTIAVSAGDAAVTTRRLSTEEANFANQVNRVTEALNNRGDLSDRLDDIDEYISGLTDKIREIDDAVGIVESGVFRGARNPFADFFGNRQKEVFGLVNLRNRAQEIRDIIQQVDDVGELALPTLRELDRELANLLFRERRSDSPNEDAIKALESAGQNLVRQYQRIAGESENVSRVTREVTEPFRNFRIELVDLNNQLRNTEDAFRNATGASEIESTTQARLNALAAVFEVERSEIQSNINREGAAFARLANSERAESEHAKTLRDLATQLRQLQVDYENDKTAITRDGVQARTRLEESYARRVDEYNRRVANVLRAANRERVDALREVVDQVREINDPSFTVRFGQLLSQGIAPAEAFQRVQNFETLTDGLRNSIEQAGVATRFYAAILRRELFEGLQTAARGISAVQGVLRNGGGIDTEAFLEQNRRRSEILAQAELLSGQGVSISATGGPLVFDLIEPDISPIRSSLAGVGDLVGVVPLDLVDAITSSVQLRRDANAEILQLEEAVASEIQSIQESVTLSAENKAKAIERIERQSALKRVQIESEVSQRQRASFQSVVSSFLSGIAQMIAAESQLALARRATQSLGGLFGGGAVAAGGAGILSSVLLPLVGGLSLAYGASKLIGQSPSAAVYQRSQFGSVGFSGEQMVRGQQGQGVTFSSQESDLPMLEANINVSVEASGTRLGQANARERLKTERWGG